MTDEGLQNLFSVLGSQIFIQSLDAAVLLFSRVANIPTESLVLPVISTNDRLTLGCELWDGTTIHGQQQILHLLDLFNLLIRKAPLFQHWLQEQRLLYMSSEGRNLLHEVFLLNGSHDRETSGLSTSGFITGIADALNRTYRDPQNCMKNPVHESFPMPITLSSPDSDPAAADQYSCLPKRKPIT
ncbi:hypothetical protein C5167_024125 [Papaver somniferum]|uniref:Uncharacterized protein n=1 Tax=Papaver somniferum TaxID=3469 RepID=A0A4Y7JNQ0_PAPSO|nr:hypothetical protein C5167_024125 [Papaver somniferum]